MKTKNNTAIVLFSLAIGLVSGFTIRGGPDAVRPWPVQSAPTTVASINQKLYGWPLPTPENSIGVETPDGITYIFGPGRFYVLNSAFPNRAEPARAKVGKPPVLPEIKGPGEMWERSFPVRTLNLATGA